ncbi:MAG: CapA family protein [Clostridiales bacterium]|nr:CapA family protein [Clostridiales bacterium]
MKNRYNMIRICVITACLASLLAAISCGSSGEIKGPGQADVDISENTVGVSGIITDADSDSDTEGDTEIDGEDTAKLTGESEPEIKTLTISAAGDCTLGVTEAQSYEGSFNDYYDTYGADYFFDGVRDIFEADDMTVVNLECVLTTSNDIVEKEFNLKGRPEYINILINSSIEACSRGNNHSYDYSQSGFDDTTEVLDEAGIVWAYSEEPGMYISEDGIKVGMVSANLISESADKLSNMESQIQDLRDEGAEVVIACCHWGIEKDYYPTDFQQSAAHALVDAGADLILGCHPHVLQGMEVYNGKVILYSMGNFCFGGNKNPSDKNTMIYQQTFTIVDGELQTEEIDASVIPCRLSSADGYNDFHPVVAEGDTGDNIISLLNEYSSPFGTASFDSDGKLIDGE